MQRRSYYTYYDVINQLDSPIRGLFAEGSELDADIDGLNHKPILNENDVPVIEQYIVYAEDQIIQMGFPCVRNRNFAFVPIVVAFLQFHFIQRSNQQTNLPYSQIQASYSKAIEWLNENKDICVEKPSLRRSIISRSRGIVNAGY